MLVSGTGITTPFTIKIKDDFVPKTTYAIQWVQSSDGQWFGIDRGAAADRYDTEIEIYGREAVINDFIAKVEANRVAGSNVLQLSNFNTQEKIFGADIDYSGTLNVTAFMDRRRQGSWKGFGETLRLSVLSPSFTGGTGSLPVLRFLNYGYDADASYNINKFEAYFDVYSYQDHGSDSDDGSFTGVFTFTDDEMIALRRFVATNRTLNFTMPEILGVAYPFGRKSIYPSGTAKLTGFEDMGMAGMINGSPRWVAKLTFANFIALLP